MSGSDHWPFFYPQGTFSVPTDKPQVFAPDLVNELKKLTHEVKELRKLIERGKE